MHRPITYQFTFLTSSLTQNSYHSLLGRMAVAFAI